MLEPAAAEAAVRIGCIHRPFHQRLETEIDATVANFGHALRLTCTRSWGRRLSMLALGTAATPPRLHKRSRRSLRT
ncbi:hypothetical protein [Burkholderia lata]